MAATTPFSFCGEVSMDGAGMGSVDCCGPITPSFPARCAVSACPARRAPMLGRASLHVSVWDRALMDPRACLCW